MYILIHSPFGGLAKDYAIWHTRFRFLLTVFTAFRGTNVYISFAVLCVNRFILTRCMCTGMKRLTGANRRTT